MLLEFELLLLELLLLEFDELLLDELELELLDRLEELFDELFELLLRELLALELLDEFELWNANWLAPADALDASALATGAAWAEPAISALAAIIVTPYFMTLILLLCCPE